MNTTTEQIDNIRELLPMLSDEALREIKDFAAYLLDRERRCKALEERVIKAEQNPDTVICNSPEEFMQAILNADDED